MTFELGILTNTKNIQSIDLIGANDFWIAQFFSGQDDITQLSVKFQLHICSELDSVLAPNFSKGLTDSIYP